ncbi:MAG: hypothetical protein KBS63_03295 [Clostridiales bacterium]|nr:hypothetical protein [Candidatus Crickella caballi]
MSNKSKAVGLSLFGTVFGIFVYHVIHYRLFCRFRKVPGKSHCAKCGHREICKKYHFKNKK